MEEEKKRRPRLSKTESDSPLQERPNFENSEKSGENSERRPSQDRPQNDEGAERRPWQDRSQGGYGSDRKPWQDRTQNDEGGERKPWQDRSQGGYGGGERKPWQDRSQGGYGGGERKPWQDRTQSGDEGGERKPWQDRTQGGAGGYERKPYQSGGTGGYERKPWQDRTQGGDQGGERRPWQDRTQGGDQGGERKPWQDRSQGGGGGGYERKPWQDRTQGGDQGGERKPWQDRSQGGGGGGYERKPYQDRNQGGGGGGYNRPNNNRSGGGGFGRKPFGKPSFRKKEEVFDLPTGPKPELPSGIDMPLNKYLAHSGLSSRRKAVEYIEQGLVTVNGEVKKEPYYRIQGGDQVICDGKALSVQERMVYLLFNKPKNVITTTDDERGRTTVVDFVDSNFAERLYPVGRLDRDTTGLIIITNDGDLANKLSHPSHHVQKQYRVGLRRSLTQADLEHIERGVELEDGLMEVNWIRFSEDKPNRDIIELEITSGRNRIVRRLFEHLGYEVFKLDRFYFAGLTKKDLERGKYRELTQREVIMLKHFTGHPSTAKPRSFNDNETDNLETLDEDIAIDSAGDVFVGEDTPSIEVVDTVEIADTVEAPDNVAADDAEIAPAKPVRKKRVSTKDKDPK